MSKKKYILLVSVLAVSCVRAQDLHFAGCDHDHGKTVPYIGVHTDFRIHGDWIYDATHQADEGANLKTHSHTELEISPAENWFIRAQLKLEQKHSHDHSGHDEHEDDDHEEAHDDHDGDQDDHGGGRSYGYFDDHVLIFEELMLVYAPGSWEFFGGKFNPVSGLDQHVLPGTYGYEIFEEYSVLGRIGAGASYAYSTETLGTHRLEGSGFFRDTTVLNQTLINGSDEPDSKDDGGIANTHDFSSWSVSLSGDDLLYAAVGDTIHELDYVLAYVRQDAGYGAEADEHADEERGVIGGVYTVTLSEDLQVRGVGEYKHIVHSHTHRNDDLSIGTAGLGVTFHGWDLGGSHSVLDSNSESDGHHSQISLGYVWDNGLGVHGGWKSLQEGDEAQKSLGLMISYHGYF
jgi:hypothetical protein